MEDNIMVNDRIEFIKELIRMKPEQYIRTLELYIDDNLIYIGLFECEKCSKPITDKQFNYSSLCGSCDLGEDNPEWVIEKPESQEFEEMLSIHDELPEGWSKKDDLPDNTLSEDWSKINEKHSTIAYFVDGWETDDKEIIIWRGTADINGNVVLESHLDNDIPDDAKFIIEILIGDELELEEELFTETEEEARELALENME